MVEEAGTQARIAAKRLILGFDASGHRSSSGAMQHACEHARRNFHPAPECGGGGIV